MAGTTPNLGLYLPGGGSSGAHLPDEVADIDPLNNNFEKIDVNVGTVHTRITTVETKVTTLETKATTQEARNQQFRGTTAELAGVAGEKSGDEYQETDSLKRRLRYNGTGWVEVQKSLGGVHSGVGDANGWITVTHGLGIIPIAVTANIVDDTPTIGNMLHITTATYNATTFRVRVYRTDTNTGYAGNAVVFTWIAVFR